MLEAGFTAASAQGCASTMEADGRQTVRCPDGLTIVVEKGAEFRLRNAGGRGLRGAAELTDKAILVETPDGKPFPFRVLTPHAVAAVRGTVWAVDVTQAGTAVFTQRGRVEVRRARGRSVTLGPGEGVDVDAAGSEPLLVKRWGEARVRALLARLGR